MAITFREKPEDIKNIVFLKKLWNEKTSSKIIKKCLDIVATELKKSEKWKK